MMALARTPLLPEATLIGALSAFLRRSLAPLADDCPRAVSDQTRAALQYVAMGQDLTHARHNDNFLERLIAAAEGLKLTAVRS
jgi:hypothetical protein